jgi:hypothetical protein
MANRVELCEKPLATPKETRYAAGNRFLHLFEIHVAMNTGEASIARRKLDIVGRSKQFGQDGRQKLGFARYCFSCH